MHYSREQQLYSIKYSNDEKPLSQTTAFTSSIKKVVWTVSWKILSQKTFLQTLQRVLYADEIVDYSLSGGNFYLQVGDRSGNFATYTVLTSDSQIELDV